MANPKAPSKTIEKEGTTQETRTEWLEGFAKAIGELKPGSKIARKRAHGVLHFDLVRAVKKRVIERADFVEVLRLFLELKGKHLTGSVYAVPARDLKEASRFWIELVEITEGELVPGDVFYLHFVHEGVMAVIAEIVAEGKTSLQKVATKPKTKK